MQTLTLSPATPLPPPSAARRVRGFLQPRLRRWLRKFRQYGRVEIDLRGVLHLALVVAVAGSAWIETPLTSAY